MVMPHNINFLLCGNVPDGHLKKDIPTFCGIQYNHAGHLKLKVHGQEYNLYGSWVFLTYPDTYFEYHLCGNEPHFYRFICMETESIRPYIESGMFPIGGPPIKINYPDKFSRSIDDAISLINSKPPIRHDRAVWRVEDLLIQLQEQNISVPRGSAMDIEIRKLMEEIRWHPDQIWDFEQEAAKLSITVRHFRRIFTECCGMPPGQYQIKCRMELAASMLALTKEPVSKIARQVGIDNEYYFSNLFKRKYNLSPSAYRKEFKT